MKKNLQKSKNPILSNYLSRNQIPKINGFQAQTLQDGSRDNSSPYKNALGQIKRVSLENDGEDDFVTPKPIKTIPKIFKNKSTKKTSKKLNKKKTSDTILKRTKDNFKNLEVNPEHLQFALALSKSTFAQEYPEVEKETEERDLPSLLPPQKIPKVTTFLEKYGFKSSKSQLYPENFKSHVEEAKQRKNSKFRFVTPVLLSRTKEEQESLINSKVSLILSQQNQSFLEKLGDTSERINTKELETYLSDKKCWNLNCPQSSNLYTCLSLELTPPKSSVGCLLKKWEDIPGREKTPKRDLHHEQKENSVCDETMDLPENQKVSKEIGNNFCFDINSPQNKIRVCSSPDLFGSEDEEVYSTHSLSLNNSSTGLSSKSKLSWSITSDRADIDYLDNLACSKSIIAFENLPQKIEKESKQLTPSSPNKTCFNSSSPNKTSDINYKKSQSPNNHLSIKESGQINSVTSHQSSFFKQNKSNQQNLLKTLPKRSNSPFQEIERDNTGIMYYESFYDYTDNLDIGKESFIDLTQSSDENDELNEIADGSPQFSSGNKQESIENKEEYPLEMNFEQSTKNDQNVSTLFIKGIKQSFMDSGNISSGYDHTSSLNVTDYVMDVLNSQEENCNEEDPILSQSSCSEEYIEILSDKELNYSSKFSARCRNDNLYELSDIGDYVGTNLENEELDVLHSNLKNKYSQKGNIDEPIHNKSFENTILDQVLEKTDSVVSTTKKSSPILKDPSKVCTPKQTTSKDVPQDSFNFNTPNNNVIIKTEDITPMPHYDGMDTPKVKEELDKFGIKPIKRKRGVELLKYIYECTHPVVNDEHFSNINDKEEEDRPMTRRKLDDVFFNYTDSIKIVGTEFIQSENEADLLFERKFSKNIISCRMPLQIAWYNFLCCNPALKEKILLYEPIHLEMVYSMLKEQSGCNFHIEEVIAFLDKKCVTFRTSQSKGARKKQAKK